MNNRVQFETLLVVVVIAAVLVIAVTVVYMIYKNRLRSTRALLQHQAAAEARFREAVWSYALVIASTSMQVTRKAGADKVRVQLELDVETPAGERYPAKSTWWVDPDHLRLLRPGETVAIRIDQEDGMRIYPNVDWAAPSEWGEAPGTE